MKKTEVPFNEMALNEQVADKLFEFKPAVRENESPSMNIEQPNVDDNIQTPAIGETENENENQAGE